MSRIAVDDLIERLIGEEEFRREFEDSRDVILSSVDLTEPERVGMKELDVAEFLRSTRLYHRPCAPSRPI